MTVLSSLRQRFRRSTNADEKKPLGQRGEELASRFLRRRKLKIVATSYKNHIGEIDLVAIDSKSKPRTVVFVEVKTRQSDWHGRPVDAVDDRKQRQISNTAMVFLKQNDLLECRFRFDIVGIIWPDDSEQPEINYYEDAFPPVDTGQMFS